jgi:hypothetical protein
MTGLSRRSILIAPAAIAVASIAPESKRAPFAAVFGERLRSFDVSQFALTPIDAPEPFRLFSTDVPVLSLDGASDLPQIANQGDGAVADGLPGLPAGVAGDDCRRGHPVDLDDQGRDGVTGLVGVVDEQVAEQRPQQQARAGELHSDRVQGLLGFGRHVPVLSFGAALSPRAAAVLAHLAILALLAFAVVIGAPR